VNGGKRKRRIQEVKSERRDLEKEDTGSTVESERRNKEDTRNRE
jgi:hypothetical protein